MSEEVELKRCAHCGSWIPDVATMCASCGTSDVDGSRSGRSPASVGSGPSGAARATYRLPIGWSVTRILIWMNALYLLWCVRVQFAF